MTEWYYRQTWKSDSGEDQHTEISVAATEGEGVSLACCLGVGVTSNSVQVEKSGLEEVCKGKEAVIAAKELEIAALQVCRNVEVSTLIHLIQYCYML